MNRLKRAVLLVSIGALGTLASAVAAQDAAAPKDACWTWHQLETSDGTELLYAVVEPEGYEPGQTVPAMLGLPPGDQSQAMAEFGLTLYWGEEARQRGWLVIAPTIPGEESFFDGAEQYLPELMKHVAGQYDIAGDRFHLTGVSNGGRAAFHVAAEWPELFHSLTVLPGYPPNRKTNERLERLLSMPVMMYVGERDRIWVNQAKVAKRKLEELGHEQLGLKIFEGNGHRIESLSSSLFMDHLDELQDMMRELDASGGVDTAAIGSMLDQFHTAASEADGETYFGCMTEDGVFIGTDASERWTREEFRELYQPYFDRGTGWTYVPRDRTITLMAGGDVAMFDELLDNAKYGVCRGVGVAVLVQGRWRIAQYGLSLAVPNDVAGDVVDIIRGGADEKDED